MFDVCVVGGGPAGSSLTLRLAQLGRSVAVVERAEFPRKHVGESLTQEIVPLLDALGVRPLAEVSSFIPSHWTTVAWAGEQTRYQMHGGPGFLVDRGRFDASLLDAAKAAPRVHLEQPARVIGATRHLDHWRVALASGATIRAKFLVEATGRSRLLRRTRRQLNASTLAIYAYWRGVEGGADLDTLVEAGAGVWSWAAPLPGGNVSAIVFVDAGPSMKTLDYEAILRGSSLFGPRLRGAQIASKIQVCDATPFLDTSPVTSSSIKVGEAALAVDPLSAQGVQIAIGTAMHAAVVLNTLLDRPDDAALAIEFYRARIGRSADLHAAAAADFYRRQAAVDSHPFWSSRASASEASPTPASIEPGSWVRLAPDLRFSLVAVADASYVVRRHGVTLGDKHYAFIDRGIGVAELLQQLDEPMTAFELVRRWSRRMPPARALQTLNWAAAEALITPTLTPTQRGNATRAEHDFEFPAQPLHAAHRGPG